MRVLFKTIYYFSIAAMGAVALLVVSSLFPTIPGAFQVKIVQSGSMEPAIKTGSMVIIHQRSSYAVGDVITFYEQGQGNGEARAEGLMPTTHRVISERVADGVPIYTTKGDANNGPDPREVAHHDILGKVLLSIPFIGFLLDFARQPLGFALLVGIPAVIVIGDALRALWREARDLRASKQRGGALENKHQRENNKKHHETEERT